MPRTRRSPNRPADPDRGADDGGRDAGGFWEASPTMERPSGVPGPPTASAYCRGVPAPFSAPMPATAPMSAAPATPSQPRQEAPPATPLPLPPPPRGAVIAALHDARSSDRARGSGGRWNLRAPHQQDECQGSRGLRRLPETLTIPRPRTSSPHQPAPDARLSGAGSSPDSTLLPAAPASPNRAGRQLGFDATGGDTGAGGTDGHADAKRFVPGQAQPFP